MRNVLLIGTLALCLQACCYKVECVGIVDATLHLEGFTAEEADTIQVVEFSTGGVPATPTDSFAAYPQPDNGTGTSYSVFLPHGFQRDMQYRITVTGAGQSFLLGAFTYTRELCSRCVAGNSYSDDFSGYSVDGVAQEDRRVVIRRR